MLKKICFDIDGVICKVRKDNNYVKSKPIKKNIELINWINFSTKEKILLGCKKLNIYYLDILIQILCEGKN